MNFPALSTKTPTAAQAMVLAAGRGERMRPLTDSTPKPLMQWPMQALARGGFTRQLVNTAWLGEQIPAHFGDRITWPGLPEVHIAYSHEGQDFGQALETAGGIVRALPRLADVFWVVAGDVFAPDFVFSHEAVQRFAESDAQAHLWLVPNPAHNPCSTCPRVRRVVTTPSAPSPCTNALSLPTAVCRRATLKAWRWRWPRCCAPPWTGVR
jgi:N-acetyl-alpha-D-muramate 1-phosphate uridylyltransferase